MKKNYDTLYQFENDRLLENYIPITETNTFYHIGNGMINIYCNELENFDLYTQKNDFMIGDTFTIGNNSKYKSFTIIENTKVIIDNDLIIDNGIFEIHGTLVIKENAKLIIKNNSKVIFYTDSILYIENNSNIEIFNNSQLKIYGEVHCHLYRVEDIYNNSNITIDTTAVVIVNGLELLGKRIKTLIDYYVELRNKDIQKDSQSELIVEYGNIRCTCIDRDNKIDYQLMNLNITSGEIILGDFKFQILGTPDNSIINNYIINKLTVNKNSTLYISESYRGFKFIHPQLYIGIAENNNYKTTGGILDINGKVIVDGKKSVINIDRKARININKNGELWLKNHAILLSSYNDDTPVLFIDGTLYIEGIEQLEGFNQDNIIIGENGKIVILNNNYDKRTVLFSTPNGKYKSKLYEVLGDKLDKVEYHIQKNTGIKIDKYYEYYYLQMTDWYNNISLEKAINDGLIIWHDEGFIELDENITKWSKSTSTLLDLPKLFKSDAGTTTNRIQSIVNRFKYIGCGNILFRFISKYNYNDILLNLNNIKMKSIIRFPENNLYQLNTINDGKLFLRNKVSQVTEDNIINKNSKVYDIINEKVIFNIE